MERKQFKDYTVSEHGNRDIEQALAEVDREIDVRRRMYDRWQTEGKFAWCDGHDRLSRMLSVKAVLIKLQELGVTTIGDLAKEPAFA